MLTSVTALRLPPSCLSHSLFLSSPHQSLSPLPDLTRCFSLCFSLLGQGLAGDLPQAQNPKR
jgi:hypothetical protein